MSSFNGTEPESKMDVMWQKLKSVFHASGKNYVDTSRRGLTDAYKLLQENNLFPQLVAKAPKSNEESAKLRATGNTAYKVNNLKEALRDYTKAICCAELDGEPISLAYANRSAVNNRLQAYNDVINDVNHALANGKYPKNLILKLVERRAESYLALSQFQKALKDYKDVIFHIVDRDAELVKVVSDFIEKDPEKVISQLTKSSLGQEKVTHLKSLVECVAKCIGNNDLPHPRVVEPKLSHKSLNKKSAFPAVDIRVNAEGKHMVATADISIGDILAVEKPFASIVTLGFLHYFCDNCRVRCHSSIPCIHCNNVVYCSENCRQTSWETHHGIECDLLPTMIDLRWEKNLLLALRTFLKATKCGNDLGRFVGSEMINNLEELTGVKCPTMPDGDQVSARNIDNSDGYRAIHELVTHEEDRSAVQMLGVQAIACCMLYMLKGGSRFFDSVDPLFTLFSTPGPVGLNIQHTAAANLIARLYMVSTINAYEIGEVHFSSDEEFLDSKFMVIGGAIYRKLSSLNHSCDPNVAMYCHDETTSVLYARKPIAKSEQLFFCYRSEYFFKDRGDRRQELKSIYFFHCNCPACVNNWLLTDDLPFTPTLVSPRFKTKKNCQKLKNATNQLTAIFQAAATGPLTDEQFQTMVKCLSLCYKYIKTPWGLYSKARDVLQRHFYFQGKHYVNDNLQGFV